MSEQVPATLGKNAVRINRDSAPALGSWHWIKVTEEDVDEEVLMCVVHVASNHLEFSRSSTHGGTTSTRIRYRELDKYTRPEPNWKQAIQKQLDACQVDLAATVASMIDMCKQADLIQDTKAPPSLLPSTTRHDPKLTKQALLRLKEKEYPEAKRGVEAIIEKITALHKDLYLPLKSEANKMNTVIKGVDKRLFALELYAGIGENAKCIRRGKPADPETPVSVRQMIRFMDEETLIDYDGGGMDYSKLEDFDKWVAKDENLLRIAPETRCVVAFQVRRHMKDYGRPESIAHAFAQAREHQENMRTYLLIRNGTVVWRLATEIEFSPRLLPFRDAFVQPLEKKYTSSFSKPEDIGPDHLDYDEALQNRLNEVYEYNRVMFLIQGLLDRSKVFNPHPPINLGDQSIVEKYFKPVFDEEDGLPSNIKLPTWEEYRDGLNAQLKKGDYVYSKHYPEDCYEYNRWDRKEILKRGRARPPICIVKKISRDRKTVQVKWSRGDCVTERWEIDMSRPVPDKPHYFYRKRIETNHGERFAKQKLPIEEVFNVTAYTPGEFKKFLCDAYLKGRYLQWAPPMLNAEEFHFKQNQPAK